MVIQSIGDHCLDSMLEVLEKFGKKWPPYPQNFKIPEEIKSRWGYRYYSETNGAFVLPKNYEFHERFRTGDTFNGVVLPKKRKRGAKYSDKTQRVYQFYWDPGFFGKVVFESPCSGNPILEQGELIKDLVYRFEITSISTKNRVFRCVPLKHVFNEQNLLQNLTNCNYQTK
jgi:hypothetical protein